MAVVAAELLEEHIRPMDPVAAVVVDFWASTATP